MTRRTLATLTAAALVSLTACGVPVPHVEPSRAGVEPTPRALADEPRSSAEPEAGGSCRG